VTRLRQAAARQSSLSLRFCKVAVILSGMSQFQVPRIVKTKIAHAFGACAKPPRKKAGENLFNSSH
jgi:hypothetical protein